MRSKLVIGGILLAVLVLPFVVFGTLFYLQGISSRPPNVIIRSVTWTFDSCASSKENLTAIATTGGLEFDERLPLPSGINCTYESASVSPSNLILVSDNLPIVTPGGVDYIQLVIEPLDQAFSGNMTISIHAVP